MLVYRESFAIVEACNYGCPHSVTYFETVELTPTGQTRPFDDGYNTTDEPLYADNDGRIYHRHHAFDSGRSYYRRDGDRGFGFDATTRSARENLARDLNGQPLTDKTPAGRSFDDLIADGTIEVKTQTSITVKKP